MTDVFNGCGPIKGVFSYFHLQDRSHCRYLQDHEIVESPPSPTSSACQGLAVYPHNAPHATCMFILPGIEFEHKAGVAFFTLAKWPIQKRLGGLRGRWFAGLLDRQP